MARVTTINSLEKAFKVSATQVTAQQLLNGRMCLKTTGWTNVHLTDEFKNELINQLIDIIGGHSHTRDIIRVTLKHEKPQHWALKRMLLEKYGKKPKISYCAGQDYVSEIKHLRDSLK